MTKPEQSVVVGVYDDEYGCHQIVIARRMDTECECRIWGLFYIRKPYTVKFGDYLEYYPRESKLYRIFNNKLKFRIMIDKINPEVAVPIITKLPYSEMYRDGTIIISPRGGT